MATILLKTIARQLIATESRTGQTIIVELKGGDEITFRYKGKRTRYEISLHKVMVLAQMEFMQDQFKLKLARYKMLKAAGRRVKKPKPPNMNIFNRKELHTALKTKVL